MGLVPFLPDWFPTLSIEIRHNACVRHHHVTLNVMGERKECPQSHKIARVTLRKPWSSSSIWKIVKEQGGINKAAGEWMLTGSFKRARAASTREVGSERGNNRARGERRMAPWEPHRGATREQRVVLAPEGTEGCASEATREWRATFKLQVRDSGRVWED